MPDVVTTNIARPVPPDAKVLFAKDMKPGEVYQTVQSADPKKQYMARLVEVRPEKVLLEAYIPDKKSWSQVEVQHTYRLIPYPKEKLKVSNKKVTSTRTMHNKVETLKKKPVRDASFGKQAPQRLGAKSGLSVYYCWGKAFAQYGNHHDAPEKIVKHMQTEFPGRKTQWKRWVNPIRARFNHGKLPGVNKPAQSLEVYRCAFLGNEATKKQVKGRAKGGSKNGLRTKKAGLQQRPPEADTKVPNSDIPVQA